MSDLNIQMADFMKRVHEQREAHERASASAFNAHRNELLAKGVTTVLCEYSGYGDSGGVENVVYLGEDNKPFPLTVVDGSVDMDIRNYAESLLPAGFEINEGGQGTVTLDIKGRTYTVDHGQNVTEVHGESWEGEF